MAKRVREQERRLLPSDSSLDDNVRQFKQSEKWWEVLEDSNTNSSPYIRRHDLNGLSSLDNIESRHSKNSSSLLDPPLTDGSGFSCGSVSVESTHISTIFQRRKALISPSKYNAVLSNETTYAFNRSAGRNLDPNNSSFHINMRESDYSVRDSGEFVNALRHHRNNRKSNHANNFANVLSEITHMTSNSVVENIENKSSLSGISHAIYKSGKYEAPAISTYCRQTREENETKTTYVTISEMKERVYYQNRSCRVLDKKAHEFSDALSDVSCESDGLLVQHVVSPQSQHKSLRFKHHMKEIDTSSPRLQICSQSDLDDDLENCAGEDMEDILNRSGPVMGKNFPSSRNNRKDKSLLISSSEFSNVLSDEIPASRNKGSLNSTTEHCENSRQESRQSLIGHKISKRQNSNPQENKVTSKEEDESLYCLSKIRISDANTLSSYGASFSHNSYEDISNVPQFQTKRKKGNFEKILPINPVVFDEVLDVDSTSEIQGDNEVEISQNTSDVEDDLNLSGPVGEKIFPYSSKRRESRNLSKSSSEFANVLSDDIPTSSGNHSLNSSSGSRQNSRQARYKSSSGEALNAEQIKAAPMKGGKTSSHRLSQKRTSDTHSFSSDSISFSHNVSDVPQLQTKVKKRGSKEIIPIDAVVFDEVLDMDSTSEIQGGNEVEISQNTSDVEDDLNLSGPVGEKIFPYSSKRRESRNLSKSSSEFANVLSDDIPASSGKRSLNSSSGNHQYSMQARYKSSSGEALNAEQIKAAPMKGDKTSSHRLSQKRTSDTHSFGSDSISFSHNVPDVPQLQTKVKKRGSKEIIPIDAVVFDEVLDMDSTSEIQGGNEVEISQNTSDVEDDLNLSGPVGEKIFPYSSKRIESRNLSKSSSEFANVLSDDIPASSGKRSLNSSSGSRQNSRQARYKSSSGEALNAEQIKAAPMKGDKTSSHRLSQKRTSDTHSFGSDSISFSHNVPDVPQLQTKVKKRGSKEIIPIDAVVFDEVLDMDSTSEIQGGNEVEISQNTSDVEDDLNLSGPVGEKIFPYSSKRIESRNLSKSSSEFANVLSDDIPTSSGKRSLNSSSGNHQYSMQEGEKTLSNCVSQKRTSDSHSFSSDGVPLSYDGNDIPNSPKFYAKRRKGNSVIDIESGAVLCPKNIDGTGSSNMASSNQKQEGIVCGTSTAAHEILSNIYGVCKDVGQSEKNGTKGNESVWICRTEKGLNNDNQSLQNITPAEDSGIKNNTTSHKIREVKITSLVNIANNDVVELKSYQASHVPSEKTVSNKSSDRLMDQRNLYQNDVMSYIKEISSHKDKTSVFGGPSTTIEVGNESILPVLRKKISKEAPTSVHQSIFDNALDSATEMSSTTLNPASRTQDDKEELPEDREELIHSERVEGDISSSVRVAAIMEGESSREKDRDMGALQNNIMSYSDVVTSHPKKEHSVKKQSLENVKDKGVIGGSDRTSGCGGLSSSFGVENTFRPPVLRKRISKEAPTSVHQSIFDNALDSATEMSSTTLNLASRTQDDKEELPEDREELIHSESVEGDISVRAAAIMEGESSREKDRDMGALQNNIMSYSDVVTSHPKKEHSVKKQSLENVKDKGVIGGSDRTSGCGGLSSSFGVENTFRPPVLRKRISKEAPTSVHQSIFDNALDSATEMSSTTLNLASRTQDDKEELPEDREELIHSESVEGDISVRAAAIMEGESSREKDRDMGALQNNIMSCSDVVTSHPKKEHSVKKQSLENGKDRSVIGGSDRTSGCGGLSSSFGVGNTFRPPVLRKRISKEAPTSVHQSIFDNALDSATEMSSTTLNLASRTQDDKEELPKVREELIHSERVEGDISSSVRAAAIMEGESSREKDRDMGALQNNIMSCSDVVTSHPKKGHSVKKQSLENGKDRSVIGGSDRTSGCGGLSSSFGVENTFRPPVLRKRISKEAPTSVHQSIFDNALDSASEMSSTTLNPASRTQDDKEELPKVREELIHSERVEGDISSSVRAAAIMEGESSREKDRDMGALQNNIMSCSDVVTSHPKKGHSVKKQSLENVKDKGVIGGSDRTSGCGGLSSSFGVGNTFRPPVLRKRISKEAPTSVHQSIFDNALDSASEMSSTTLNPASRTQDDKEELPEDREELIHSERVEGDISSSVRVAAIMEGESSMEKDRDMGSLQSNIMSCSDVVTSHPKKGHSVKKQSLENVKDKGVIGGSDRTSGCGGLSSSFGVGNTFRPPVLRKRISKEAPTSVHQSIFDNALDSATEMSSTTVSPSSEILGEKNIVLSSENVSTNASGGLTGVPMTLHESELLNVSSPSVGGIVEPHIVDGQVLDNALKDVVSENDAEDKMNGLPVSQTCSSEVTLEKNVEKRTRISALPGPSVNQKSLEDLEEDSLLENVNFKQFQRPSGYFESTRRYVGSMDPKSPHFQMWKNFSDLSSILKEPVPNGDSSSCEDTNVSIPQKDNSNSLSCVKVSNVFKNEIEGVRHKSHASAGSSVASSHVKLTIGDGCNSFEKEQSARSGLLPGKFEKIGDNLAPNLLIDTVTGSPISLGDLGNSFIMEPLPQTEHLNAEQESIRGQDNLTFDKMVNECDSGEPMQADEGNVPGVVQQSGPKIPTPVPPEEVNNLTFVKSVEHSFNRMSPSIPEGGINNLTFVMEMDHPCPPLPSLHLEHEINNLTFVKSTTSNGLSSPGQDIGNEITAGQVFNNLTFVKSFNESVKQSSNTASEDPRRTSFMDIRPLQMKSVNLAVFEEFSEKSSIQSNAVTREATTEAGILIVNPAKHASQSDTATSGVVDATEVKDADISDPVDCSRKLEERFRQEGIPSNATSNMQPLSEILIGKQVMDYSTESLTVQSSKDGSAGHLAKQFSKSACSSTLNVPSSKELSELRVGDCTPAEISGLTSVTNQNCQLPNSDQSMKHHFTKHSMSSFGVVNPVPMEDSERLNSVTEKSTKVSRNEKNNSFSSSAIPSPQSAVLKEPLTIQNDSSVRLSRAANSLPLPFQMQNGEQSLAHSCMRHVGASGRSVQSTVRAGGREPISSRGKDESIQFSRNVLTKDENSISVPCSLDTPLKYKVENSVELWFPVQRLATQFNRAQQTRGDDDLADIASANNQSIASGKAFMPVPSTSVEGSASSSGMQESMELRSTQGNNESAELVEERVTKDGNSSGVASNEEDEVGRTVNRVLGKLDEWFAQKRKQDLERAQTGLKKFCLLFPPADTQIPKGQKLKSCARGQQPKVIEKDKAKKSAEKRRRQLPAWCKKKALHTLMLGALEEKEVPFLDQENFLLDFADLVTQVMKSQDPEVVKRGVQTVMRKLFDLKIIRCQSDYYTFVRNHMPYEFRCRSIPCLGWDDPIYAKWMEEADLDVTLFPS